MVKIDKLHLNKQRSGALTESVRIQPDQDLGCLIFLLLYTGCKPGGPSATLRRLRTLNFRRNTIIVRLMFLAVAAKVTHWYGLTDA